jgi:transcriptional regulator with XRE-family HTH domain
MARAQHFAARLALAREARGLSQRDLSLTAGFSSAHVGHLEAARSARVPLAHVEPLAKVLRVTPEWLAFGVGAGPTMKRRGSK